VKNHPYESCMCLSLNKKKGGGCHRTQFFDEARNANELDKLVVNCLASCSRIFHPHGEIPIVSERVQNLG
jgi:hypothetical protein